MLIKNILTERENEIINKKLKALGLTQNESNILSKYVRPKLKEIKKINADTLLNKLEYNQKAKSIEIKIKKIVLENLNEVKAILVYGSAIQTNYKNYNDIDLLIITESKTWDSSGRKYDVIIKLTDIAKKIGLNLDIQLIDVNSFYKIFSMSPSLIYQLKDHKIIYGKIRIPSKIQLSKLDLRMKLDWSDIDDLSSNGNEIYQSLRNVLLVRLLLNKIVNNEILRENLSKSIGDYLLTKLKKNTASKTEKRIVLEYIKDLSRKTDEEIKRAKWEKIEF